MDITRKAHYDAEEASITLRTLGIAALKGESKLKVEISESGGKPTG